MNGIWFFASFASVNRNCRQSSSTNSRGVQLKTSTPSWRPPVSGTTTSPERLRAGAQNRTEGNGPGSTPSFAHPAAASSSKKRFGLSSHSRSSPFTLKTRTRRLDAPSPTTPGWPVSIRRKNSANDVLVATPLMPLIDMCPPLRPSKKSRSTATGSPSRPMPIGRGRPISSR